MEPKPPVKWFDRLPPLVRHLISAGLALALAALYARLGIPTPPPVDLAPLQVEVQQIKVRQTQMMQAVGLPPQ